MRLDFISKKFMKLKSNERIPVFKYEDNNDEFEEIFQLRVSIIRIHHTMLKITTLLRFDFNMNFFTVLWCKVCLLQYSV